jgi:hypothetical protein
MACGPALAGFLQMKFKIYSLTFNQSTLPGWVMSLAWLVYLLWLTFKEPEHLTKTTIKPQPSESGEFSKFNIAKMFCLEEQTTIMIFLLYKLSLLYNHGIFFPPKIVLIEVIFCMKIGHQGSANLEDGIAQPLILEREQTQAENTEDNDDNDSENTREPARSIASAYRLLTPSVKVSYLFLIMFSLLSITLVRF